jgi:outer membrane receptor protein involved in Fe transport
MHRSNSNRLTSRATARSATFPFSFTPIGAAVGLLLFAGHAAAQNAAEPPAAAASEATADVQRLDQVVVRSRNRIERVQDVPLSVSVVTSRDLERELALDIGAITKRAANVERNSGNSRTYSLSIRGVGKVGQTESQDTSVGVIQDGVNLAYAPLSSFDFYDVESVEVARGPQGTLLGKNSTMGVVVINTRKPSFTPDASWSVTLGQRNTVISQLAGGGPVIDDLLAWRGAVSVNKGGGYYQNAYNPDQTYYDRDRVAGRLQFLFTPTPDFSARAVLERQPKAGEYYNGLTFRTQVPARYADGGLTSANNNLNIQNKLNRAWFAESGRFDYADYLNPNSIDLDNQRPLMTSTQGASLELKWNLGSHDLTSITAYRDYHFHARNDEGTPYDISLNGGGKVDAYRQQSQELRLASKQGGFVDYQVGALFFRNIVDVGQQGYSNAWGSDAGAWFASNLQYNALDVNGSGRALLVDSLDGVVKRQAQFVKNKSLGLYGQADWHFTERTTLTTGVRFTREDRRNSADSLIVDYGKGGQWLNPVTLDGIPLGGFNSVAFNNTTYSAANPNAGTAGNLTGSNSAAQIALANRVAQKYFGVADYNNLTQQQKAQVAAAKAIRQGQYGRLWALTESPAFRKTQPGLNISPSYKLNDDQTTYLALQYGEKGAVAQIVNGTPRQADPEKVTSLEWGLKSALLNKTLFVNFDIFQSNVRGYQQSVSVPEVPGSATQVTYTGNADKVVIRGLEVDGAYTGWRNITVRFSGAYNEAKYKSFTNSPTPAEYETAGVLDQSGNFLSGASRVLFNLGAEYRLPVFGDKVFHTSFNAAFKGRFNSDNNLSQYAYINSRVLADASIGIGRADGKFDVNLIVKNVFDDRTPQAVTWNSITPGDQRWIGIQFSGKL